MPKGTLIIDNGSVYLEHLKAICAPTLKSVVKPGTLNYRQAEAFDTIILSGGYQHEVMGSETYYMNEMELIKHTKTPTIGICLGFQLIAHSFQLPINKMKRNEYGVLRIEPTHLGEQILGTGPFKVFEDHRWVVSKTPKDFHALAISKDGIEAIKHVDRPLVGFQFHPEMFVTKSDGRNILRTMLRQLAVAS